MAETYRGLTIRIGGDTTKLTKALHAANQAISGTQSELRKLSTALRLDPSSLKASQLQMGAMSEQASNTAAKMAYLNQAIKEVGSQEVVNGDSVTTLKEMVEATRNIQMQAALMRDGFNQANASLRTSYESLNKLSALLGSQKTFSVVNDNTDLESLGEEIALLKKNIEELRASEDGVDLLKAFGVEETGQGLDELYARMVRLKSQSKEYGDALKNANDGARFKDLNAEAAKTEATIKSFVDKLSKANETMTMKEALDGIKGSLDSVNNAIESAKSRISNIDKALKIDPKNPQLIADRMKAIADGSAAAKLKVDALKKVVEAFKAKGIEETSKDMGELTTAAQEAKKKFDEAQTALAKWEGQLAKIEQGLIKTNNILAEDPEALNEQGRAYSEIRVEQERAFESMSQKVDQYKAKVTAAAQEQQEAFGRLDLRRTTEEIHQAEVEAENFGKINATPKIDSAAFMQAVSMVSQAARRMASEIVQSSNEIDSAYRDMRKTVQGTESDFDSLKKSAPEYSQSHITSADTMLEMQALGGQLGILIEDLGEFGKITSNLDISTNIEAEDIALQLGQVANVLDLDIAGMQGFADALVRLGNNMPTQESNIMNIAQRFAAVASTANFSGSEILAWAAAIASTGQRSEMAATAIGNTVSGIEQATATGGNDLKQFAAIAQMSADDFKAAWKEDPTEALKAFIEGLKTLKDSDTGAVAALENMGITGVRQQQTLLGLSNTIDKLGDALVMSKDAWEGVDDQWGQAGDAAIEAQKKSEGFSGALGILQNNAQNLAQSLGDSLVMPMKVASGVIGMLTDALNNLPGPFKSAIVLAGGAALTFGTVAPVLKVFTTGIDALVTAAAQSGGTLSSLVSGVAEVGMTAEGSAAGVATFGSALSAIGIAAVVIAVTAAVSAFAEFQEEQENLKRSTEGFATVMEGVKIGYDNYVEGAKEAVKSVGELKEDTKKLVEEQANLADSMRAQWEENGKGAAMVDELTAKIVDLSEKSSLTKVEQDELAAAVKSYNDITNASVRVIDEQTGKLSLSTEALKNNTEAWKENAENEVLYEQYKDLLKQRAEDLEKLTAAEKTLEQAQNDLKNSANDLSDAWIGGEAGLFVMNSQTQAVDDAQKAVDTLKKEYDAADDAVRNFFKEMSLGTQAVATMRDTLEKAGYSTEEFDSLTEDQMRELRKTYYETAEDILAAIERIKSADKDANGIASELAESSKAAAKARAAELKTELDAEYKALKKTLDAEYKEAQRAADREYKQQQREYDAEYKAAQKAYDAEYKAAQKAYDKEYKQLQKALDAEYKALQKNFDKEYSALKKELDAEYNARKKQYDAQLKALKDAQDDEVDAFNKATDAKLKAMEREYKQKLRMLELEYGQRDSALDEEIKRLDAETEAEKKAIETRKENDKKAELQKAVDQAKSRRTRAEAEKALNDYLQELDQKHHEEERKTEQERLKERQDQLKDELQARKDALKEQYDNDVAAYKDKRAAELEALQEANDIEYEARKANYDLILEQMKEAHTIELESLKEFQTAELEAVKEANAAELENLKEYQTASLESMKETQQAALDALKQAQQDELDALKQHQQDALEALKQSNQDQLDEKKATNSKLVEEAKSSNAAEENEQKRHEQEAKDTAKRTGNHINDGISMGYKKAMGATMESSERMKKEWDQSAERAREYGNKTGDGFHSGISRGMEKAMGATKSSSEQMERDLKSVEGTSRVSAEQAGQNYLEGLRRYQNPVSAAMWAQAQNVRDAFDDPQKWSYGSASDAGRNFYDGLQSWTSSIGNVAWGIASTVASYLHFSVPDKGPLKDEDEWGGHLVQNLIDGIRDREGDLVRQVENMARAVEDGFDPTLTVDAAYEAIDAVNKGRSAQMAQVMSETKSQAIEVNVSLSDVSIRSDADIDRLATEISRRMADQVRRQRAGRL